VERLHAAARTQQGEHFGVQRTASSKLTRSVPRRARSKGRAVTCRAQQDEQPICMLR